MSLLMGGSLVLIAASAGALVIGWLNASRTLIVTSMAAVVAAGVLLLVAFLRGRSLVAHAHALAAPGAADAGPEVAAEAQVQAAAAGDLLVDLVPEAPVAAAPTATKKRAVERGPATKTAATKTAATKTPATKTPATKTPATKTPAKKTPAKKTPAKKTPAKKTPATGTAAKKTAAKKTAAKKTAAKKAPRVVVFPDRDKYHRPDCRFAAGRGSEKVTVATARRRGYEPCGVCHP